MSPELTLKALRGKTLTAIEGLHVGSGEIVFDTQEGPRYRMYHEQDCCEGVAVQKVSGDVFDVLGTPVLSALESTSNENPPDVESEYRESFTWTEFAITTANGTLTIRWLGESNGYYGEGVDFVEIT